MACVGADGHLGGRGQCEGKGQQCRQKGEAPYREARRWLPRPSNWDGDRPEVAAGLRQWVPDRVGHPGGQALQGPEEVPRSPNRDPSKEHMDSRPSCSYLTGPA